jgi:multidrug efflux pump subunit AcrA (membrane-fusion protein)
MRHPLFLAATALLLTACQGGDATPDADAEGSADSSATADATPSAPLSLPVVAEEVIEGDLVLTVLTKGEVRSEAATRIKAEVGGTVQELLKRPGDRVRKGEPLLRLTPYEFELAVREAQAAVDEATIRFQDNIVPDSIATGRGPGEDRRRGAMIRSGLAAAQLRLERARFEQQRATVTAPFDGVVDRFDVSLGERITAGAIVTTLVDERNLRVEASVLEHDLALVKAGGEALVTSAAAPDRPARGRITAVLPLVDSTTRAGRAYVRLQGNDVLKPGMYADVRLEAQRLTGRILVPTKAIIERDNRPLVFVVKDGRAQWTYIMPGRSNGLQTEVLPDTSTGIIPLTPGDQVITAGHLTLTHDAAVRVVARRENDQ